MQFFSQKSDKPVIYEGPRNYDKVWRKKKYWKKERKRKKLSRALIERK